MISDEDIQRVRQATNIVDLVSETVVLKQRGQEYWGCCPFHNEKTPSFKVNAATGLWHCFGACQEGGDAISYIRKRDNLEFADAVRALAEKAGIELVETGSKGPQGPKRNRIIDDALDSVGLMEFCDRSILTLSGGERKLVFIARSLAQGVDTIVLDEPTNHLDIRHQLFILDYLRKTGKTILIVLHDLRLASYFCDELYLIKDGCNLSNGAPLEVLTRDRVEYAFGIHGYSHLTMDDTLDFHIEFMNTHSATGGTLPWER